MKERTIQFLECTNWDMAKGVKKNPITKFIDPSGKVWSLGDDHVGPCGCSLEDQQNAFRFFFYCPRHLENGILIYNFRPEGWFWIPEEV